MQSFTCGYISPLLVNADYLNSGVETEQEAFEFYKISKNILYEEGFHIKNFMSVFMICVAKYRMLQDELLMRWKNSLIDLHNCKHLIIPWNYCFNDSFVNKHTEVVYIRRLCLYKFSTLIRSNTNYASTRKIQSKPDKARYYSPIRAVSVSFN